MKYTHKGFTLVELLISMGIMTILMVILTEVFGSILAMRVGNEAISAIAQDSRYILAKLSYDTNRASSISSPEVGVTSSTLTLVIGGVTYQYTLSGNDLVLSQDGGVPVAINSSDTFVKDLTFTKNNSLGTTQNLTLNITIQSKVSEPGIESKDRTIITSLSTK